ncbi:MULTISPECIES: HutD family protein [unclassified Granulicatella]|uniref:HutD family protein n=1 Tax=unclassified Granulicatella TaxID=2630493 RepID=UPI0010734198|nr:MULTISPECIES: HutD family protein [unclassified Granulicatella]MBF0780100.1 HutD family protein [Granulicatella sp. 19428wC4_WM01]TFU95826.1 hypothetical protein E4T68_03235 [Granulicatella sp. WM01]
MKQDIQYLSKENYKVTHWSGGKTTEICLSPADGHYQVGGFDYRVSSATIELNETVFTKLAGYQRIIMSLTNQIDLYHGQKHVILQPFTPYYFSGAIETKSVGKCIDFNLIYTPNFHGKMTVYNSGDYIQFIQNRHYIIYAVKNGQYYDINSRDIIQINQHDSVQFVADTNNTWKIEHTSDSCCIVVEVYKS